MSTCGLYATRGRRFGWEPAPPLCGKPGVVLLRTGCEHEHVSERPACADHEAEWLCYAAVGAQVTCVRCRTGPRPHRCVLSVEWVPLEVAA